MKSEKLEIGHKGLLYERLRRIDIPIAEYSFANIYLFRKVHDYEVVFDENIFIKGKTFDGLTYLMPTADLEKTDLKYLRDIMKTVDFLFPVPESWLDIFNKDEVAFSFQEGDMDYVYRIEKMRTYAGRRMHGKRNLLKQFEAKYEHDAQPLTKDLLENALHILNGWQESSDRISELTDYEACFESITLYDELVLCGGIYYADKEPAGFVIGEELNDETFALHFAKGLTKFKGIYQYMFNNFSRVLPEKYNYLNLEQDLDNESLRAAKSSYQPDLMIKKVRVCLKK